MVVPPPTPGGGRGVKAPTAAASGGRGVRPATAAAAGGGVRAATAAAAGGGGVRAPTTAAAGGGSVRAARTALHNTRLVHSTSVGAGIREHVLESITGDVTDLEEQKSAIAIVC